MRGSIRKRCQCRDKDGRRIHGCRKAHGSWTFTIDVGVDASTARRKQLVRSGFSTRDEAQEAMTSAMNAVNTGMWTDDKAITVGRWLDQWLDEFAAKNRSPKTLAGYRSHVRLLWRPQLGHLRLRDLRRGHIERALGTLVAEQKGERSPGNAGSFVTTRSAGTVDNYRRTLRAALAVAVRRELLPLNPALGRMDAIPDRRYDDDLVIWEPEETARFLEYVRGDRLAALYEVAAFSGLRRAELCGLRWSDLTDDGAGARIRQTVVELTRSQAGPGDLVCPTCGAEHVGRLIKGPKSRAGRRWVPLAAPAREALRAHRRAQLGERADFGPDYRDHDLIFCRIDGDPIRPSDVTKEFKSHVRDCGLPMIRLHDTRHGACSLLLAGGVPIEVVQMILGHASPEVTRKVYGHLMKSSAADQVEVASQLVTKHRREQSVSKEVESADNGQLSDHA
jgi:integrase